MLPPVRERGLYLHLLAGSIFVSMEASASVYIPANWAQCMWSTTHIQKSYMCLLDLLLLKKKDGQQSKRIVNYNYIITVNTWITNSLL